MGRGLCDGQEETPTVAGVHFYLLRRRGVRRIVSCRLLGRRGSRPARP